MASFMRLGDPLFAPEPQPALPVLAISDATAAQSVNTDSDPAVETRKRKHRSIDAARRQRINGLFDRLRQLCDCDGADQATTLSRAVGLLERLLPQQSGLGLRLPSAPGTSVPSRLFTVSSPGARTEEIKKATSSETTTPATMPPLPQVPVPPAAPAFVSHIVHSPLGHPAIASFILQSSAPLAAARLDGSFLFCNAPMTDILGCAPNDLRNVSLLSLCQIECLPNSLKALERLLTSTRGATINYVCRWFSKSAGQHIAVHVTGWAFVSSDSPHCLIFLLERQKSAESSCSSEHGCKSLSREPV